MRELNNLGHWVTPRRVMRSHPATGQARLSSTLHTTDKLLIGSNSVSKIDEPHPNTEFVPTPHECAPAAASSAPSQDAAGAINSSSCGSVEGHASRETVSVAVSGLRERRPRDMEAAGSQREAEAGWPSEMARVMEQASNRVSQDSDRIAGPATARGRAGIKPGPQDSIPEAGPCGFEFDINSIPDFART